MTVIAPPEPPRQPDGLEALIEEARRRARRRRLLLAMVLVAAAALGGGIFAALELIRGGSPTVAGGRSGGSGTRAEGRIQHALATFSGPAVRRHAYRVDLATGRALPLRSTQEVWFDPVTHLYRVTERLGAAVVFSGVGSSCLPRGRPGGPSFCHSAGPFFDAEQYRQEYKRGHPRKTGDAMLRGRRVIWLQGKNIAGDPRLSPAYERVALDRRTLRPVAAQNFIRGRLSDQRLFVFLPNLRAGSIAFPVPEGGAPRGSFPPALPTHADIEGSGPTAAQGTLGRQPLWLGRRFLGYSLESIKNGVRRVKGYPDLSAPTVRIVYRSLRAKMPITLYEYTTRGAEAVGPKVGIVVPPDGQAYVYGRAALVRDGVVIGLDSTLERPALLRALARLRPIPAG